MTRMGRDPYPGLGRAALLRRAIDRDPSVGPGPTRGPAIVFVDLKLKNLVAAVYLALIQNKHSRVQKRDLEIQFAILKRTTATVAFFILPAHVEQRIRFSSPSVRKGHQRMRNAA